MAVEAIFCLDCEYPLGELESNCCPECGLAFDLNDAGTFRRALVAPRMVFSTPVQSEAYLIRQLLESLGIPAIVIDSDSGGFVGIGRSEVQVGNANVEEAKNSIREYEAERSEQQWKGRGAEWECGGCGERVDGTFEICWNCQAERMEQGS